MSLRCCGQFRFILFQDKLSFSLYLHECDHFKYPAVDKGRPLPKFGEWDVNDPASAEGFTVIFNKARDEKKTGGKVEPPSGGNNNGKPGAEATKTQPISNL
ncbi:Emp24/gp25L/p24 family/GOLD family protein isoform 1 [Hibiscus syriacus]|uniref:Emp24/gp25L/p24 family/GOLD family protein isoform 1 n=1 Tax=Hibiscus syriacus TaxID=106335 RepID=A0A6A2XUK1_HIBSY|nr:Emp24/gp25L/p24 family/GOLD family protein isoform 1 [Hibiscus syriacus]